MISLHDNMFLYHGSYTSIPNINLDRCISGLDFGTGFYFTSSFDQAYQYVPLSVKKTIRLNIVPNDFNVNDGQISIYKFHYDPNLLAYYLQEANIEWLHFVATNRKKD